MEYNVRFTFYTQEGTATGGEALEKAVREKVEQYTAWQCAKLGRDINPSRLIAMLMETGIKRVDVEEPAFTSLRDGSDKTVPQLARLAGPPAIINGGYEDPLLAVDGAATSRGVDLDFLNERIEHGVCQFGTLPVFVQKADETAGVGLLLLVGGHGAFQFRPALFQCRLFTVVLAHKPLVLAVRQLAQHIAFIKALYQNIQFVYTPPDTQLMSDQRC